MNDNIQSYFDNHPNVDVFHFTSDGFAFFREHDARNHASHLDNDEVLTVTREELDNIDTEE